MIRTDKQLKATRERVKEFEQAFAELEQKKAAMDPIQYKLEGSGLISLLETLREEVREYEMISDERCKSLVFEPFDISEFPDMLIKARLVRKMSQAELARLINVDPQQIQRYEANGYDGVGFERLLEIQYALKFEVSCEGQIFNNDIFETGEMHNEEEIVTAEKQLTTLSIFETTI